MSAVLIDQVTKGFGAHVAVADLSLEVPAGSIYGFIGPNGSGKTTTLRMIMRILHPDRGTIRVLGEERLGAANNRVAYLPEERGLYKQMKVRDVLRFYAELKGRRHAGPDIDAWLARLDLANWANKKVETLSKGMSQKVQFIAAVVARPELVLLDEPFSGLDPVNLEVLRDAILGLRRDGATVIFSTHDMAVAEKMCDFIFMIYKGRKVLDGTLESIQDAYGSDTVHVLLEGQSGRLEDLPGVVKVADFGRWQELRLEPNADPQQLLARLMERGKVRHFELARPTLHDIFVRIADPEEKVAGTAGALPEGEHVRKSLVIARREYLAAVKTKTFLIGLVLMPVLMGGSIVMQILMQGFPDVKEKTLAVIDRSPDHKVSTALSRALTAYNEKDTLDPATGKQVLPRYELLFVTADWDAPKVLERMRATLEGQMRKGDLLGFLEIGPDVLQSAPAGAGKSAKGDELREVVFETNRMGGVELRRLLERVINEAVQAERGRAEGLPDAKRLEITRPVPLVMHVHFVFIVPGVLMMLMFLVLMMVANPLMQGVIEEKMQRIAEVLLGSVTPFELMLGKLLGMTAVSLTIVIVYLGGGIWAACYYGFASYLPSAGLLVWFFAFQTLAALMYGSLFTAIGAACTDIKETQNLLLPVMLLCCVPLFLLGNVMREPNSPVVTGVSYFPFATPMLMIGRMAVPPGVAWWQPLVGVGLVLATTLACVWVAGRIFRVGLLLQGKAPRLGELVRWVFRG